MSSFLRFSIMAVGLLLIMACIFTSCQPTPNPDDATLLNQPSVLALAVQPQSTTYSSVGQIISYNFVVTNNGNTALVGPVAITDSKMTVLCPNLNTIGNLDANLDPGESVTCAGGYTITQEDLNTCSVIDIATATISAVSSNTVTTTIRCPTTQVLGLTIAANPTTYSATGQSITFSYTITNTGTATIGPGPFTVTASGIPNPITCGDANTTLATNQTVSCQAVYTVTGTDMAATQISHTATAAGPGGATSQQASIAVTNTNPPGGNGSSDIPRGSTISHIVVRGDWMLQISRCYGADYDAVRAANPQVIDPHWIYPNHDRITVPNVGSNGTIYGPPCTVLYIVKSGDTWQSIATTYNADLEVLMEANRGITLTPGQEIKVPRNSRMSGTPAPPDSGGGDPIRLNLSASTPTITQQGTISTPQTINYVFAGTAGQVLTVKLTVPSNDVNLAIYAPNGTPLKTLDLTNSWSGTLNADGDHRISLVSQLGSTSKSYTLEVTLTTPAPALPVERAADINPGSGASNPSHLTVFNGALYFQANAGDGVGSELWRYDRGLNAVSRVADVMQGDGGSEPAYLTQFGDMLYFRANGNDGAGVELWRFNGSSTGRVFDLIPGAEDSNPSHLAVFNNALYFSARGNDGAGIELWRYDGTTPTLVEDINPGSGDSSPAYLEVFSNALYFSATSNDGAGTELWRYDGTDATRVDDINEGVGNSNPAFLTVFNDALYFSADGNDGAGTELWRYDGTNPPARIADINVGAAPSVPTYLAVFSNALYFSANADVSGFELWKFDGTTASRVADINSAGNSNPAYLTVYNNELYFQATGNDNAGAELWRFKGP